jgi:hypothetical protein
MIAVHRWNQMSVDENKAKALIEQFTLIYGFGNWTKNVRTLSEQVG